MTHKRFFDPDPGGVNRGHDPDGLIPASTPFGPDPEKTLVFSLVISLIFARSSRVGADEAFNPDPCSVMSLMTPKNIFDPGSVRS